MTNKEIAAIFARRNEVVQLRDTAAIAASYAEDCVVESPVFGRVVGRDSVERSFHSFFAAFPDATFDFKDTVISGNRVVQTIIVHGTDTGGFLGQAPTGKPFRFFVVIVVSVMDNGLIKHEQRVYDVNGLMLQLAADHQDVSVPSNVAYQSALNRARLEHDLKIAAEIQQALLPELHYQGIGFDIAATSVPCRAIGGDFLDYFDLPLGFGFALGDVAGKGPPAALLAAEVQGILAALSYSVCAPAETVTRVNQVLVRRIVESRFVTMLFGVLSSDGRLTYCNAGHNPPLLVGARGVRRLEAGGLILGAFKDATFEEETIQLDPGDMLIVFSDGITEAVDRDGADFGEERLMCSVSANRHLPPAGLLAQVLKGVSEFSGGPAQTDDQTALIIRYTGS